MSILSTGEFYGVTRARCEAAGIAVSRLEHREARKLPMHVHRQPYFSMVLQGGYREETGRRTIDCAPMSLVYHPPATAHVDEIGEGGVRFLMIEVDERLVQSRELEERVRSGYPTTLPPAAAWSALRLLGGSADSMLRESITFELLASVGDGPLHRGVPGWLARVLDRVRDEFRRPPNASDLAREAGVHPVHLARSVRRATGGSLGDLVRQRRVEQAMVLLAGSESLAAIAGLTGFSDQAHFTRVFRSVTGLTPAAMRQHLGSTREG